MAVAKVAWNKEANGPLTEEAVRRRFQPAERYRISRYVYPVGTAFRDSMRAGTCHVINGSIQYDAVKFGEGEVAEVDEGTHEFKVIGSEPVVLVFVWPLPSELFGA